MSLCLLFSDVNNPRFTVLKGECQYQGNTRGSDFSITLMTIAFGVFIEKSYVALPQTMWTSYSFIHDVKSHFFFFYLFFFYGHRQPAAKNPKILAKNPNHLKLM